MKGHTLGGIPPSQMNNRMKYKKSLCRSAKGHRSYRKLNKQGEKPLTSAPKCVETGGVCGATITGKAGALLDRECAVTGSDTVNLRCLTVRNQ